MHKKRLIAVAVALGLPLAAHAADSNVTIYGQLYPQFQIVKGSGATAAGVSASTLGAPPTGVNVVTHNEVAASASKLGFRGTEDLGGGLKAIWQIEQEIPLDVGGGVFADRPSFVGLSGGFGTIKLGRMNTVYRDIRAVRNFLGVGGGNFTGESSIIARPGFGTSSSGSFQLRQSNAVLYESPEFGGVQFLVMYSPDEAKTASKNADLVSYGVTYVAGPLYLALAHEIHNDFFGGSRNVPTAIANPTTGATGVHSKDQAVRASAKYKFGATQVKLDVGRLEYKESGGAPGRFESYKKNVYAVDVAQKFGKVTAEIGYARGSPSGCTLAGGVACSTGGLDGKLINVGASYDFSKRTWLFVQYTKLINGSSATHDNLDNTAPSPGTDVSQLAVGISHKF